MTQPMISLTIDGKQVEVPRGTLLVEAAKKVGIDIPVFCYHPHLKPAGMCRMCLVEIGRPQLDRESRKPVLDEDGNPVIRFGPNLETACTTKVDDGWVVRVNSPRAIEGRKQVVEFLLTSHPLDCPICDKGGECPLQNLTMEHGSTESRFVFEEKHKAEKHVPLGSLIFLDRERCIQCGRCVRFQEEVAGDPVIAFSQRGRNLEIITTSHPGFDSYFSGNTTDICPVGALTTADFRFGARPWEMRRSASICTYCPVGCNLMVNTRREVKTGGREIIKRVMPRQNEAVNGIWLCDKGRFGYHYAESENRLRHPLARIDGELVEVSWQVAFNRIMDGLQTYGEKPAGLAGGYASNEDYYLLTALMKGLGGEALLYDVMGGGTLMDAYGLSAGSNLAELGEGDAVVVVAADLHESAPIWWLRVKAAAERGAELVLVNPRPTRLAAYATHNIRYRYGGAAEAVQSLADVEQAGSIDALSHAAAALKQAEGLVIFCGGEGLSPAGSQETMTACARLLKAVGKPGETNNGIVPVWSAGNTQGAWDMGLRPVGGDLRDALDDASLLYVLACDPIGDDPSLQTSFEDETFVIVHELFLTETARLADVVLPAQSRFERDGTMTTAERRVQRFFPVIAPQGTSHPDWKILSAELEALQIQHKMTSAAEVFEHIASMLPAYMGISLSELHNTPEQWPPVGGDDLYYGGTAYKNVQGVGVQLPTIPAGDERLASSGTVKKELPEAPLVAVPVARLYDRQPLLLESAILHSRLEGDVIKMNPSDAGRAALTQGETAQLRWGAQQFHAVVRIDEDVPEGIVLVPHAVGKLRLPVAVELTAVKEDPS